MTSYAAAGPKALLELKGEALLSRQLRSLGQAGVSEFIIVGGYHFDQMKAFVSKSSLNINLVYNPFYSACNSIGSLWFAREFLDETTFVTNGDTFFDSSIFEQLNSNANHYIFGIDRSKRSDADYSVIFQGDEILDMGKDIPSEEVMAEYIGIALLRKQGIEEFRNLLEKYIFFENYNLWWEELFIGLMSRNLKISLEDVTGKSWFEIDLPRDYRKFQRFFS